MGEDGGVGSAWRRIPPEVPLFLMFWALVHSPPTLLEVPQVLTGAQVDADGYIRLVRVGLLFDHGNWFDGSIHRSNWPFGEEHHWTRPLPLVCSGTIPR